MPDLATTHLLIVEDDTALAQMLVYNFEREGFAVRHTASGEQALAIAKASAPALVLLDWMLEEMSGIEVCRRLRHAPETKTVPVVMLTARGEEADRILGLEAGADDYVTKPFSPRELVARVRAVLRRVRPVAGGETLRFADVEMDITTHKVRRRDQRVALGPTEYRLLRHFLENSRRVFSRERLLDAVWGHDPNIDARTVDVHVRRLRQALNRTGAPDLIRTVRAAGYALDDEE